MIFEIKLFIGWIFYGCYHDFDKWKHSTGFWYTQYRSCKKCGKTKLRNIQ